MALETSEPAFEVVGDYELIEKIAEGGMGTVHKGRHRVSGDIVAIKLVALHMANNPTYLQRFEKEYQTARSLDHPNIVRAMELGTGGGRHYLVMEFVQGESVGQMLERVGKLPEAEAIGIITQAAQGLIHAHNQGLIHRDIKPDNIMVSSSGIVKIADLGLVKELDGDLNLTRTGRGLGTPHFMAPEQFRNAKNATIQCDIYSLGATLYMMVTGQMPFAGSSPLDAFMKKMNNDLPPPRKLLPTLSENTDWAIRQAMDSDPDKRPRLCQEFVDQLAGKGPCKAPSKISQAQTKESWWYLQYRDEGGQPHLVKGTVSGIRRTLKEGRLGDAVNVSASPTKKGKYLPLTEFSQFTDLVPSANWKEISRGQKPARQLSDSNPEKRGDSVESSEDEPSRVPHFRLEIASSNTWDFVKLLLILAVAVGTGVAMALYLQN
ncbi:MAG TPA: serine/threonine-protein kinase [Gemmataceae bacterium]|jgi:serine/threonine protein kinase|nr:serine/threonine-protein kinase [Gemmataceae bacterium]